MNVGERLRRLRRPGAGRGTPTTALESLEAELLGLPGDRLSLKERLERLVAAASATRWAAAPAAPVALEDLVASRRVTNARGEFLLIEGDVHLESRHGDVPLSRFHAVLPETVGVLSGEAGLGRFDLAGAVFLDTETTGLSGGAGTAAFLVGIGFVDGERFRVRQYFMRDYHEEPALLEELARDLSRFPCLVTFNGKLFDVPLLEARYRLNRARFPLSEAPHLDLLHPARRLWKGRLDSCRLQSLESALLGVRRHGDVPGDEIPRLYFEYVRSRRAGALPRILEHNRLDVVSLAALAVLACQWVEEARAEDPRDIFSLARVFERAQLYERSDAEYRRALAEGPPEVRAGSLMRLAARTKRAGDHAGALALWEQAAEAGEPLALRELAMHHEHRAGDLGAALAAAERGLHLVSARAEPPLRRAAVDFLRRRARLLRKLAAREEASAPVR